jgi:hypothetical protein
MSEDVKYLSDALYKIRLRCTEEGNCWLWTGATHGTNGGVVDQRTPSMHFEGATRSVRRVVYAIKHGAVPKGKVVSPDCGQRLCVSPHCLKAVTVKESKRRAAARGAYSNPAKNRRGALTKRAASWITEELVQTIKAHAGPASRIASETGVSLSHVKAIRRGAARRDFSSPMVGMFTSLLASNESSARRTA